MRRPCSLHIVPDEMYRTERPVSLLGGVFIDIF